MQIVLNLLLKRLLILEKMSIFVVLTILLVGTCEYYVDSMYSLSLFLNRRLMLK